MTIVARAFWHSATDLLWGMKMKLQKILLALAFVAVITLAVVLTQQPELDCDSLEQQDISGAVLATDEDQDALVNRAIIEKSRCRRKASEKNR